MAENNRDKFLTTIYGYWFNKQNYLNKLYFEFHLLAPQPGIAVVDKEQRSSVAVNVATPPDMNIRKREHKKLSEWLKEQMEQM